VYGKGIRGVGNEEKERPGKNEKRKGDSFTPLIRKWVRAMKKKFYGTISSGQKMKIM